MHSVHLLILLLACAAGSVAFLAEGVTEPEDWIRLEDARYNWPLNPESPYTYISGLELHQSGYYTYTTNLDGEEYMVLPSGAKTKRQTQSVMPTLDPSLPRIRFGRTTTFTPGSAQTFFGRRLDLAFRLWQDITNESGGILINGTTYLAEQIVYNDGADCNTMLILYERLIVVDGVKILFAPTGFDCQRLALLAERYRIPYLNGADSNIGRVIANNPATYGNLTMTFNWLPQYDSITACFDALIDAGMETYVIAGVPEVPDYAPLTRARAAEANVTELAYDVLSLQNITASGCDAVNDLIDKWKALDPDVWVGSASTQDSVLVNCMHRKKFHPRKGAWWWTSSITSVNASNAWQFNGSLFQNGWNANANFSDPLFGSTQQLIRLGSQRYNLTITAYEAQQCLVGTIAVEALKAAQSWDPDALRAQILAFRESTAINSDTHLLPGKYQTSQTRICFQTQNVTNVVVWPKSYPGVQPVAFPWTFIYPQYFLDSLKVRKSRRTPTIIGGVLGGVLGGAAVIGIVVFILIKTKYHVVTLPKGKNSGSKADTWG